VEVTGEESHRSFCTIADLLADGGAAVLSGAGLSTESGIPDYRGPTGLARRATPMTYQAFTGGEEARRRYWARSHLGWRHIAHAQPNAGHRAVASLERAGLLAGVITQNVDGLHQAAGASSVTDLHGSLHQVICLSCGVRSSRVSLDARLRDANPGWDATAEAVNPEAVDPEAVNPDGDAVVSAAAISSFAVAGCLDCGGMLKPDVVFFGENVPPARVAACYALVEQARSLIVLGSSLTVMSGFRYVRHAAKLGLPVAIVNQGATRGDPYATVTLDAPLGQTLTDLVGQLSAGPAMMDLTRESGVP
jgi:NAD-dependent SIR2 family protein deacetylase